MKKMSQQGTQNGFYYVELDKGYLHTVYNSAIRQTFLNVNVLKRGGFLTQHEDII